MSKPEWGMKRTCQSCNAPFYDLRRDPIVCPKCGSTFDPEAVLKSRRGRVVEKVVIAKDVDLPEVEVDDDVLAEGDDSVMEDTSDLGEDDDVSEVIEGVEEENER